ncbi:FkbM family methyltransferase [Ectopseudomonas khazarica]|uniref:FkbM family methyltransferase n=1 Tax=Ectopseudomonas khazarica TaxID=2502979 RepID=UPI00142EE5B3|nr:FkbM family methyltransferase [Pseudomonas khazarica]
MDLELSEHMQRRIFWMGYYSEDIAHLLNETLQSGMTVLDIGANIGEITLLASKRVGMQGQVFAFEPIENIAQQLERHVEINQFKQTYIERLALGDATDSACPIYASCGQITDDNHNGLGSLYGGNNGESPVQYIRMTTLDNWITNHPSIQRIDLIKIDIEGAELACLHGARDTLLRFRPRLIVEIQDFSASRAGHPSTDILDFLSELGYRFQSIGKNGSLTPLTTSNLTSFQNVFCTPT